jgi:hypothetical protein
LVPMRRRNQPFRYSRCRSDEKRPYLTTFIGRCGRGEADTVPFS